MVYLLLIIPTTGLIMGIIGIKKNIKWAGLMCIMWALIYIGLFLSISIKVWWPSFAIGQLGFIIQIIWILLANKEMRKER